MTKQDRLFETIFIIMEDVDIDAEHSQIAQYVAEKLCEHPSLIIAFVEDK